jgi:sec-independent protein translocase protein TatB
MTGVGFFEILLIGIVGLLILGPDKLPGALRTMALWIGRFRRSFDDIKRDIEKEIGADDIRRQLRNEAIMDKFQDSKKQITDTVNSAKKQTDSLKQNLDLKQQILSSGKPEADKTSSDKTNLNEPAVDANTTENLAQAKATELPEPKEPKEPKA